MSIGQLECRRTCTAASGAGGSISKAPQSLRRNRREDAILCDVELLKVKLRMHAPHTLVTLDPHAHIQEYRKYPDQYNCTMSPQEPTGS